MRHVAVAPIAAADLPRVGDFLHRNLNSRLSATDWAQAALVPWSMDVPNHGFMLLDENYVVGVYLAFYSNRLMNGKSERFCNLGAWCVVPRYRLYSLQLLRALLAQPGYHFTDLSPSGNTVPVNERHRFARLDTTTAMMPNLPWRSRWGRYHVSSQHTVIESALAGPELQIYRDHRFALAAHHVVMVVGSESCYVMFRRDRRKNIPLFASVLYVSNPDLFLRMATSFGCHLLARYQVLATLMELRVVGGQPAGSFRLRSSRPKMFKSESLQPEQIDNLYSELTCVGW